MSEKEKDYRPGLCIRKARAMQKAPPYLVIPVWFLIDTTSNKPICICETESDAWKAYLREKRSVK